MCLGIIGVPSSFLHRQLVGHLLTTLILEVINIILKIGYIQSHILTCNLFGLHCTQLDFESSH